MRRLVAAGCLEGRSQRRPGRLVDPGPEATLRRATACSAAAAVPARP